MINIQKETLENGQIKYTMKENKVIDTKKYIEFVRQTTSPASSDLRQLIKRITELEVADDIAKENAKNQVIAEAD